MTQDIWVDGKCNACGSVVVETGAGKGSEWDYRNTCTNSECKNFEWHYCFDDGSTDDGDLDYYEHGKDKIALCQGAILHIPVMYDYKRLNGGME